MFWVLNSNLYRERGYDRLMEILPRMGIRFATVKTVPMTDRLMPADADTFAMTAEEQENCPEPFIDTSGAVLICGSYTLAKIAVKRGWKPGAFIDNLDYVTMASKLPADWLLNPDATILPFKDVRIETDKFIRPVEDSKVFSGRVYKPEEWADFHAGALKALDVDGGVPGFTLDVNTPVIVSAPVEIFTETRFFVVDGKVVTHGRYKRGNRVVGHIVNDPADPHVIEHAQRVADFWQPQPAFVVDIAETPEGLKIVEYNSLTCAGFYGADVQALVMALEDLGSRYEGG